MNRKITKRELIKIIKEEVKRQKLEEGTLEDYARKSFLALALILANPQAPGEEVLEDITGLEQYVEKFEKKQKRKLNLDNRADQETFQELANKYYDIIDSDEASENSPQDPQEPVSDDDQKIKDLLRHIGNGRKPQ